MTVKCHGFRMVVYAVHGCTIDGDCRRRPVCESPQYSGFVERKHCHYIGRHATEGDAWSEAYATVDQLRAVQS